MGQFFSRQFTEITLKAFDRELWTKRGKGLPPGGEIKARARGLFANRRREARIVLTAPRDNRANWQLDRVRIRRCTPARCSPGLTGAFRRREALDIFLIEHRPMIEAKQRNGKKVISIPFDPFHRCIRIDNNCWTPVKECVMNIGRKRVLFSFCARQCKDFV